MSQWLSNASPSFTEFQNYIQTDIKKLNNRVNRMLITWSKSGLKLIIKKMFLKVINSLNTSFIVVFYSDYRWLLYFGYIKIEYYTQKTFINQI